MAQLIDSAGNLTVQDPAEAAVQSVFAKFTAGNALTTAEQTATRRFITSQVISGNMPYIYSLKTGRGLGSEAKCLIDFITSTPGTGTGVWNVATGVQTDGSTNYYNSAFIQSTQAVPPDGAPSQNDIYVAIELISNDHGTATGDLLGGSGSNTNNQIRYNQTVAGDQTYKVGTSSTRTLTGAGPFVSRRWHSVLRSQAARQGTQVNFDAGDVNTTASAGTCNVALAIGAFNNNGTISGRFAGKFGGFLACSATRFNFVDFFVNWAYYMQELGVDTKEALYPYDLPVANYNVNQAFCIAKHGQSNQAGRATARAAKLALPLTGVQVAWRNPALLSTPFTAMQTLQFGVNNNIDNLAENGTELRIGYELARRIRGQVNILKHAINGTAMVDGLTSPDWNVTSNELSNIATNVIDIPALQIIDDTKTIKTLIFEWNQGEADSTGGASQAAYESAWNTWFKYWIDQIEAAGYTFGANNVRLHVVIRKVYSGIVGSTPIRAALSNLQTSFLTTNPSYSTKVQSWTVYDTETDVYTYTDGVHLSSTSIDILGLKLGIYYSRL